MSKNYKTDFVGKKYSFSTIVIEIEKSQFTHLLFQNWPEIS
jgi:hypothetical protein